MNRLKQKLKSESGASILIALMFFLICALVASTLLMASVSNAGKIKSNREMHQKYLTVSSALELICDDLISAKYYGQYRLEITNDTGNPQNHIHTYIQTEGQYDCELKEMLIDELDSIFAETMEADVNGFTPVENVTNKVTVFPHQEIENRTHTLIVAPAGTDGIKLSKVQITVTLDRKSYTINLTARLVDDASYGMEAELTPIATNFPHAIERSENSTYSTEPMTWKLGWITKAPDKSSKEVSK